MNSESAVTDPRVPPATSAPTVSGAAGHLEVAVPVRDAGTAELVKRVNETVLNVLATLDESAKAELLGLHGARQLAELLLRSEGDLRLGDTELRVRVLGASVIERLLTAEGGCLEAVEAAARLGVSRQALSKRRLSGTVLGIPRGNRFVYPAWQFDDGSTLDGLAEVLSALPASPWARLRFFVSPNDGLEGARPIDRLRAGHVDEVVDIASIEYEHVAS